MSRIHIKEDLPIRIIAHIVIGLFGLSTIIPFVIMLSASFSSEASIVANGYRLLPQDFSLTAYKYIMLKSAEILRAYGITVFITVVGTGVHVLIAASLGYSLSRKDLPFRKFFIFYVVFTMLFNGGLVPTYLIYTQYLHIKNTIWALIVPTLLLNGFTVLLMKTYFSSSIPFELIESGRLDGAGEIRIFWMIVLPLAKPILVTVGLLGALNYWNDWFNGLIYLTKPELFSLQNILNRIMTDIQFLKTTSIGSQSGLNISTLPSETVRMAMAAIGVVPILLLYPFFQKYFIKGIALGAVKG